MGTQDATYEGHVLFKSIVRLGVGDLVLHALPREVVVVVLPVEPAELDALHVRLQSKRQHSPISVRRMKAGTKDVLSCFGRTPVVGGLTESQQHA